MKKQPSNTRGSRTVAAPARKKLAVKKDALKDLSAVPAGKAAVVKGGTYSVIQRCR